MKQITAEEVKKDNSNIRKYSDILWRALRKERYKKARPDAITNEMAAEQFRCMTEQFEQCDFKWDVENFCKNYLTERESKIFALWLFGGRIKQAEIGTMLGISQPTVNLALGRTIEMFKKYYFAEDK